MKTLKGRRAISPDLSPPSKTNTSLPERGVFPPPLFKQVVGHERVFALGDLASMPGGARPALGHTAEYQASTVCQNVRRVCTGRPLCRYLCMYRETCLGFRSIFDRLVYRTFGSFTFFLSALPWIIAICGTEKDGVRLPWRIAICAHCRSLSARLRFSVRHTGG